MNKEEKLLYSLSAIKNIFECFDIDVEIKIEKNDKEYIVNAYKEIEKCIVDYVNSLQPYKFDELKKGMWVWDDEERECRKILETYVTGEDNDVYVKGVRIVRHGLHEFSWKYSVFKEGRFFPITKALEYQK